ncbi:MAG: VWA domain-containing protein [Nitrospina sp.]|jgi:magnesium chelatase subunit D|nr:VWA domain-containing protein [Nitrospina sp.]MBT3511370.1 VWA domain-containing protein [Nitrospina sp.]MBT3875164.1 VWA domain-containing protein [Nitrospina sp.]MBT4047406.1 VWA domain-containing protein [Nitrospina sp.]MBT4556027.1 VWA domain-containing protein [Nitrospina sp.]
MTVPYFPFSAIVGQEKLKEALILNAINPSIGGVLIFGEKGTAKSTAVRGLKNILGLNTSNKDVPLVELPLSATEEMIVGTINIPDTLKTEKIQIEYGLLHKANNGIIYIDEVNLLEDHLVDVILDAAAMGVNRIEREGVSHEHPANFILVGTMNPEEGELRPQLLDRFGISAKITTETDIAIRKDIVCRRLEWEEEKQSFSDKWQPNEISIGESIEKAKQLLPKVVLSEKYLELAINIALQANVEGHRVDIIISKTAKTLTAYSGRLEVNEGDIYRAAEYALNHRTDSLPTPPPDGNSQPDNQGDNLTNNEAKDKPSGSEPQSFQAEQSPATQNFETLDIITDTTNTNTHGKTLDKSQKVRRGKVIGSMDSNARAANQSEIAFFPSLVKGIRRGKKRLSEIDPNDLRFKRRISGRKELHVLVVDTSASMGTLQRLSYAKGLMQRILKNGYQKKNYVAVVGTQGNCAQVVLKPTRNFMKIDQVMDSIKAKGKTPLLHAIDSALNLVESFHKQNKFLTNLLVVISDGRINVPFRNSMNEDLNWLGKRIKKLSLNNFVVDSNQKFNRSFLLQKMVRIFEGRYMVMEDTLLQGKISL